MKTIRMIFLLALLTLLMTPNVFGWSYEEAAKPFRGQKIRLIGEAYAPWEAYLKLKPEFEKLTGIEVIMEGTDHKTAVDKSTADLIGRTGIYDGFEIVFYELGKYAERGWLMETKELMELPGVQDPTFDPARDIDPEVWKSSSEWKGKYYGLPYEFLPPYYCYRKDLAGHPGEQKAFKAKYGYDMPIPPKTYLEFYDLAEFFTRKKGEKLAGETLDHDFYGTCLAMKRHVATWYDYQKILNAMGGSLLTPEGKVATDFSVNIKALEFELSLMKFSPPGTLEYTWDEQYSDMTQGFVFSHNSWPDSFPYFEDPNESKVAGKLGYYLPPETHHTVSETHTWCVPPSSKRKEAVWLWFQWLNTFDVQKRWALTGGLPVRTDVMRDPEVYKLAYYPKLLESFDHLVVGPKIPQAFEMMDITIQAIIKAAMGEATATEALRWAAKTQRELVTE